MSGETTTVSSGNSSAGSWKQRLLPAPVGKMASTDVPASGRAITGSWPSRNVAKPNMSRNFCCAGAGRDIGGTPVEQDHYSDSVVKFHQFSRLAAYRGCVLRLLHLRCVANRHIIPAYREAAKRMIRVGAVN